MKTRAKKARGLLAALLILAAAGRRASAQDAQSAEELSRAQSAIEEAIRKDGGNSELWVHLGMVHRKMERLEDAKRDFEKAAQLNPANANAHFMLGLVYEKTKERDRAIAAWEACLKAASDEKMRGIAAKHLGHLRDGGGALNE